MGTWERRSARSLFNRYRHRRGSFAIASEFALNGLLLELKRRKPRRVLEFGPGIGATTEALLAGLDHHVGTGLFQLTAVEVNAFCRSELEANLDADDFVRVELLPSTTELRADERWDFVLVDGPGDSDSFVRSLAPRAVVFVENDRPGQRADLLTQLGSRSCASRSVWPLWTTEQMGGYHVFQMEPTVVERLSFSARDRVHRSAFALRPWVRKLLGKAHLGFVISFFSERADRHRISAKDLEVDGVAYREGL